MKKRISPLVLALALLVSPAAPALAADNGIAAAPGHQVLSELPAALQRPARPVTLEQAEGRVGDRSITLKRQAQLEEEFREQYRGYGYSEEEIEAYVAQGVAAGAPTLQWKLAASKESVFQEIAALTDSLTAGKATDAEKVKAIYDWVSQNIVYDTTAYNYWLMQDQGRWLTDEQKERMHQAGDAFYVYAQKLGICGGYATLSWLMCSIAEIPVAYIVGVDRYERGPHAWNAALLDGKWLFFDATWSEWDMAPSYHNTTDGFSYCDGAFQVSNGKEENDASFWLCPGFECPETVVMPEGCFQVMAESFLDCATLKSITLPSTCTEINMRAFQGCTGLTSITIPKSVEFIHWDAFKDCSSLETVTFQNPETRIWKGALDGTALMERSGDFVLTSGILVKYKGADPQVTIPAGVTAIADYAFAKNLDLREVVIPEGVTTIGADAFVNCYYLKTVTIPSSVKSIGESAFAYTPWLEDQKDFVIFNNILLAYQGEDVRELTVPDGVTDISDRAFYYHGSNTRVLNLPASVTRIGEWAFSHSYLEDVYYGGTQAQWANVEIVPDGGTNWVLRGDDPDGATVHYNGVSTAYASTQTVQVDGRAVTFHAYALKDENGYDTNFVKLRDVAAVLNGSAAQFEVDYDGAIAVTTQAAYTPNGSENIANFSGDQPYTVNTSPVKVNGAAVSLDAITLTDAGGGGYTYFKLRDLGAALGFHVSWSADTGIFIETEKPRAGE